MNKKLFMLSVLTLLANQTHFLQSEETQQPGMLSKAWEGTMAAPGAILRGAKATATAPFRAAGWTKRKTQEWWAESARQEYPVEVIIKNESGVHNDQTITIELKQEDKEPLNLSPIAKHKALGPLFDAYIWDWDESRPTEFTFNIKKFNKPERPTFSDTMNVLINADIVKRSNIATSYVRQAGRRIGLGKLGYMSPYIRFENAFKYLNKMALKLFEGRATSLTADKATIDLNKTQTHLSEVLDFCYSLYSTIVMINKDFNIGLDNIAQHWNDTLTWNQYASRHKGKLIALGLTTAAVAAEAGARYMGTTFIPESIPSFGFGAKEVEPTLEVEPTFKPTDWSRKDIPEIGEDAPIIRDYDPDSPTLVEELKRIKERAASAIESTKPSHEQSAAQMETIRRAGTKHLPPRRIPGRPATAVEQPPAEIELPVVVEQPAAKKGWWFTKEHTTPRKQPTTVEPPTTVEQQPPAAKPWWHGTSSLDKPSDNEPGTGEW